VMAVDCAASVAGVTEQAVAFEPAGIAAGMDDSQALAGLTTGPVSLTGTRHNHHTTGSPLKRLNVTYEQGTLQYTLQIEGIDPVDDRLACPLTDGAGKVLLLVQTTLGSQQARNAGSMSECSLLDPSSREVVGNITKIDKSHFEYRDAQRHLGWTATIMRPPADQPIDQVCYRIRTPSSDAFVAALDGDMVDHKRVRTTAIQVAAGMDLLTVLAFHSVEDRLETPPSAVLSAAMERA